MSTPFLADYRIGRSAGVVRERRLHVIRNARLDPKWADIKRSTLTIVGRAISSLIPTQGIGDLYRIYVVANRDEIDFNLAYIPPTITTELKKPFDTTYMNALFKVGYDLGSKGYPWAKLPPGYRDLGAGPTLNAGAIPTAQTKQRASGGSNHLTKLGERLAHYNALWIRKQEDDVTWHDTSRSLSTLRLEWHSRSPGQTQNLMVYPAKGQSPAQQDRDRYECHNWAVQQSGFDPTRAQVSVPSPYGPSPLGGAARGAAIGAVGGAIGCNAGKGAEIGATTGALIGGLRRRDQYAQQQSFQQ